MHVPLIRECCQRHHHKKSDSRCITSQDIHPPRSSLQIPYTSPSNRNSSHSANYMAGRKSNNTRGAVPKYSMARKYVKLADTKIAKDKLSTKADPAVGDFKGGSFDNRTNVTTQNCVQNVNPFEAFSSRAVINQSENIIIENNY